MAHHAILVGITSYPGLSDLQGPEHDVDEFRAWLVDPAGGNVPLANVVCIKSSDFPKATDAYEAKPADSALRKELQKLLFNPDQSFKGRVGERLYLFFAGHGFASRQLNEAALYSAQATRNDPDNIAGKRYAAKIVNSAAFDEVVLIMDCCRDVDLSDSIHDPGMKIPERAALAANVRFLEAYAAGRGQQARERVMQAGGDVRGLFTYAFVDALRNAEPNSLNEVTGQAIKSHIHNKWPSYFSGGTPYEVHIAPPTGATDIVFTTRPVAQKTPVRFMLAPPLSHGPVIVIFNSQRLQVERIGYDPAGPPVMLASGYYKAVIEGTARNVMIEVNDAPLAVTL